MSLDGSYGQHEQQDADASQPLLSPAKSLVRRGSMFLTHGQSTEVLTSVDAEYTRGKFEFPTSRQLVGLHVALSLGYCAYMMTSWLDLSMRHKILFPVCTEYWGSGIALDWGAEHWMAGACVGSIAVFWLFPIFCCMILLLFFYRDLLQTRIYYTMLAHQVHLDFTNVSFLDAISVRIMLTWCVLCFLMYPFAGVTSARGIMQTLPFWIPVVSFGAMLYNQWDLEQRLVSVAKLVEKDVEWAGNHVKKSFFLRDYIAERAFHKVRKEFDKLRPAPQLTSGEYIKAIAEAAEMDHHHHLHDENEHDAKLKKQSHISVFWAVSPWYWMRQLLYSPYLVDQRAKNFHFWFSVYFVFTSALMLFLILLATLTIVTHLHMQGIVDAPPWMRFEGIAIQAVHPVSDRVEQTVQQQYSAGLVQTAARALRGSGALQWFEAGTSALQEENAALKAQNAALLEQSQAKIAEVAALMAEVAALKAGVSSAK